MWHLNGVNMLTGESHAVLKDRKLGLCAEFIPRFFWERIYRVSAYGALWNCVGEVFLLKPGRKMTFFRE